jgi:hypothetical protein
MLSARRTAAAGGRTYPVVIKLASLFDSLTAQDNQARERPCMFIHF